jgi:hypothetical protein
MFQNVTEFPEMPSFWLETYVTLDYEISSYKLATIGY